MRETVRAFLFDVHGTLVDKGGKEGLEEAWSAAAAFLQSEGYAYVTTEVYRQAYWETLKSFSDEVAAMKELDFYAWYGGILRRLHIGRWRDRKWVDLLNEAYMEGFRRHTVRLAGAAELLEALRQKGYRLACVSNGFARNTRTDLERVGLLHFFEVLVCSSDVGWRKPHPAVIEAALAALSVGPSEAIVVGNDRLEDVLAAKRAGVRAVLVNRVDSMAFIREAAVGSQEGTEPEPDWRVEHLEALRQMVMSGVIT